MKRNRRINTKSLMLNIGYNVSSRLNEYLSKIENLRKQILLKPISPKTELKLRWEAMFNRTYACLKLSGNPLTDKDILKILTENMHKKMSSLEMEAMKYKKSQDFIFQNWLGSNHPIDAQAILDLSKIIGNTKLRVPKAGLGHLLDYLQARPDSPIVKSAIIYIEMHKMRLFSDHNFQIACLAPLLFLYKYGYDFRGFLAYETEWIKNANDYTANYTHALRSTSLTLWLEYFAKSILNQAEKIVQSIEKPSHVLDIKESFWKLNERQKSILPLLDSPQATLTNRQIQKIFKTSQITASRDLSKLTKLGFLFSHGKGRSVYYTKI